MKRFWGFVIKEFYHIIRDKRSLIILLGMPIAQILLFGFAITNEITNVKLAVIDKSNDEITAKIKSKLFASGYFTLSEDIGSEKEIVGAFQKGKIKAVVVFEANFARKFLKENKGSIQVITDATEPNIANTVSSYVMAIAKDFQLAQSNNTKIPYAINVRSRMVYNPELKGVFMFIPGVMTIILMLVTAMMTSISIAREKEIGTMEVLLVSPLNPLQVILGKVLPYIVLAAINATVIMLLGVLVFEMPIQGSILLLMAETMLFIITALSLGILISTVSNSQQTAMLISLMGLMLPVILLSGFIFPISSMPWVLQTISNIIPARWFIIIIKGVLLKGVGLDVLWKETLILLGMASFFILVSVKKYKSRLE